MSGGSHAGMRLGTTQGGQQLGFAEVASGAGDVRSISFVGPPSGVVYVALYASASLDTVVGFDNVAIEETGSYVLTGSPITLTKAGRILQAAGGSYGLSGAAIEIRVQRRLPVSAGEYLLSRPSIQLRVDRKMSLDAGSYTLTGRDITITHIIGRFIFTAEGSYNLAGAPLRMVIGRRLVAGSGTYSLSGNDVSWVYRRRILAAAGAYAMAGADVRLLYGRRLAAAAGSYVLTGSDLGLVSRRLTIGSGSYNLSGSVVSLRVARRLQAAAGAYVLNGSNLTLLTARRLALAPGAYVLSGSNLNLRAGRRLSLVAGAYTLTGAAAGIHRGYTVHAASGAYALVGSPLRIVAARRMTLLSRAFRLNWMDVNLVYHRTPPGPRSIAVGFAASRYLHVSLQNRREVVEPQSRRIAVEPAARRYAAVEPRDKETEGGSMLQWPEKDPNEVLDYQLDWADPKDPRLEASETLLTSVWSIVEGDVAIGTPVSTFTAGGLSTVWASGGTNGTKCILLNRVTTSKGRTYDKSVVLRVRTH